MMANNPISLLDYDTMYHSPIKLEHAVITHKTTLIFMVGL
jgi:hypothetical protein